MENFIIPMAAAAFLVGVAPSGLTRPAFAQGALAQAASTQMASPTGTVADPVRAKPPLTLTEPQRRRVVDALSKEDTLDKVPPDYQPTIGAKIPPQKKLAAHPLPRPLIYEIPALKQYYYARLPQYVLIIDPMKKEVVAILQ
jgi:hypothetical protein